MENSLDSDVLLPPRKRLLAGFKRHNPDVNLQTPLTESSCGGNGSDTPMNNLLKDHPNLSSDEIVVALNKAAEEASKVASATRIVADEKAVKAAKAKAAAKSALELVASFDEATVSQEKQLKKKKKHVAIESLYGKRKSTQNSRTDEELARELHQVINSSPRISTNISTDSELQSSKPKKLKISPSEINGGNAVLEMDHTFVRNGTLGYNDSNDRVMKKYNDGTKFKKQDRQTFPEDWVRECDKEYLIGKKRWNVKQKKLPMSIENPKENPKANIMSSAEDNRRKPTTTSTNVASRDERFLNKESLLHRTGG